MISSPHVGVDARFRALRRIDATTNVRPGLSETTRAVVGKRQGDGHAPIGPSIVTRDEGPAFSDACALDCKCFVNGTRMQSSNTRELIFKPIDILVYASSYFTLNPGDLIFTGTPGGVGVFRKPTPLFLKEGDVVKCSIDGIGAVENRVTAGMHAAAPPPSKRAKL